MAGLRAALDERGRAAALASRTAAELYRALTSGRESAA